MLAVFFGILLLGSYAFALPPPGLLHDQSAAIFFSTGDAVIQSDILAQQPLVPVTHVVNLVQTRAAPAFAALTRPKGDGSQPGGDRDVILVACLRPEPALAHEKGFTQPAIIASSGAKEVFRDFIVASLRPGMAVAGMLA